MARTNPPLLSMNRGIISPRALARVDLDRTRLSAEIMRNVLPSTLGPWTLRPGTKFLGSSARDTGAEYLEFVASTDDVALLEVTNDTGTGRGAMRVWLGSDAHNLSLLSRPAVDTTVSLSDTGWVDASTGGNAASGATVDIIPTMTGATTSGVTITASSEDAIGGAGQSGPAWHAADDDNTTVWADTGPVGSTLPSWWNVDFGASNAKTVRSYSVRAGDLGNVLDNAPNAWRLIGSNHDTGTFATDTGKWTLEDERSAQTGWALSERRTYTLSDTCTPDAWRHWRLHVTAADGDTELIISEVEMFEASGAQAVFVNGLNLNATSIGARAIAKKRVIVDTGDVDVEHSLVIQIGRGPVVLRVGSTDGDDDYVSEASLGTGYHNLAFTPSGNFWIRLQNDAIVDRVVSSLEVGDSGTVEVTTPWTASDLDNIRYDQSADVIFTDCDGVRPQKIERRGTGRSWAAVSYEPNDGPFLPAPSSSARLSVSHPFGNTTLNSDIPFFSPNHAGALIRMFHNGQSGQWRLGALDAATDPIQVTGIGDTGTAGEDSERRIVFSVSGTWDGRIRIERSIDGPDIGFKPVPSQFPTLVDTGVGFSDTGTFSFTIDDQDDNVQAFYRAKVTSYTSGVAEVTATYGGGGVTGIGRITEYNSNTSVGFEVLSRFSDTGPTDNWQEGFWSTVRGFPTAVALHGGRLGHAQGGSIFLSVSDDFESFDESVEGEAGPIIRTLGSGPVDRIRYLVSLLRLLIGTAGAELTARSSSLDEPLTPENSSVASVSTQGSANVRALKMDTRALMVQRSAQRVYMVGPASNTIADYEAFDLTLLVPDLMAAGIVSVAIQRQPDTRLHCALADGTVAILTYEPSEEVICWFTWKTSGSVERVAILPGLSEDAVFYHIRRTIGSGNDSFTKVLLHFDGVDGETAIRDSNAGGSSHAWTANGNAQIDTANSQFGGASLLCDGTGDFVSTPDSADLELGSRNFTIDCWFNCTAATGSFENIAGKTATGSVGLNAERTFAIFRSTADVITAVVFVGANSFTVTGTTQFTDVTNTGLHHVAFVRTSDTLKLFIDGTQEGGDVAVSGAANDLDGPFSVGGIGDEGANEWTGWIDEFRLSVGVARWTEDFTPPTAPYGNVRRYLEKWAQESECFGDTGLCWLADSAVANTDTGKSATINADHLGGESVIVWGSDTGTGGGKDFSPGWSDTGQTRYALDTGGNGTLGTQVHHKVVGLPYEGTFVSSKLAYGAELGTALAQQKRAPQLAMVLYKTHRDGIRFGSCYGGDTGTGKIDSLPRVIEGETVDADRIFETLDKIAVPMPSTWHPDVRVMVKARAPRPATCLALVPTVVTNER